MALQDAQNDLKGLQSVDGHPSIGESANKNLDTEGWRKGTSWAGVETIDNDDEALGAGDGARSKHSFQANHPNNHMQASRQDFSQDSDPTPTTYNSTFRPPSTRPFSPSSNPFPDPLPSPDISSWSQPRSNSFSRSDNSNPNKKSTAFKSVSVTKNFLAKTAPTAARQTPETAMAPSGSERGASSISQTFNRPRLVAKSGKDPRTLPSSSPGSSSAVPDASKVWNRNKPATPAPSKQFTDEELKQQYGIHMTARLEADETGKEAKWADLDDDEEDWAPETVTWMDGTKSTINPADDVSLKEASKDAVVEKTVVADSDESRDDKSTTPNPVTVGASGKAVLKPGARASSVAATKPGIVLKSMPDASGDASKATETKPSKSAWAQLPPVDKTSPVAFKPAMAHSNQMESNSTGPVKGSQVPEVNSGDFHRSEGLWDSKGRQIYDSRTGRYQPVNDARRLSVSEKETSRTPAVLRRDSQHDSAKSAADIQANDKKAAQPTGETSVYTIQNQKAGTEANTVSATAYQKELMKQSIEVNRRRKQEEIDRELQAQRQRAKERAAAVPEKISEETKEQSSSDKTPPAPAQSAEQAAQDPETKRQADAQKSAAQKKYDEDLARVKMMMYHTLGKEVGPVEYEKWVANNAPPSPSSSEKIRKTITVHISGPGVKKSSAEDLPPKQKDSQLPDSTRADQAVAAPVATTDSKIADSTTSKTTETVKQSEPAKAIPPRAVPASPWNDSKGFDNWTTPRTGGNVWGPPTSDKSLGNGSFDTNIQGLPQIPSAPTTQQSSVDMGGQLPKSEPSKASQDGPDDLMDAMKQRKVQYNREFQAAHAKGPNYFLKWKEDWNKRYGNEELPRNFKPQYHESFTKIRVDKDGTRHELDTTHAKVDMLTADQQKRYEDAQRIKWGLTSTEKPSEPAINATPAPQPSPTPVAPQSKSSRFFGAGAERIQTSQTPSGTAIGANGPTKTQDAPNPTKVAPSHNVPATKVDGNKDKIAPVAVKQGSPSPPPPETSSHPAHHVDSPRPTVQLPKAAPVVKLPSLSASNSNGNATSAVPARLTPRHGAQALVNQPSWQDRFNGLFGRKPVTAQSNTLPKQDVSAIAPPMKAQPSDMTTASSVSMTGETQPQQSPTVSLPNKGEASCMKVFAGFMNPESDPTTKTALVDEPQTTVVKLPKTLTIRAFSPAPPRHLQMHETHKIEQDGPWVRSSPMTEALVYDRHWMPAETGKLVTLHLPNGSTQHFQCAMSEMSYKKFKQDRREHAAWIARGEQNPPIDFNVKPTHSNDPHTLRRAASTRQTYRPLTNGKPSSSPASPKPDNGFAKVPKGPSQGRYSRSQPSRP